MNHDYAFAMLVEANPIPDAHEYAASTAAVLRPDPAAFLTDIDQERDDMTQLMDRTQESTNHPRRPWWQPVLVAAVVMLVVGAIAVFAGTNLGGDAAATETDVAEDVDSFVASWNAGDEAGVTEWLEGVTYCERGPTCREGTELVEWMLSTMATAPAVERTTDVVALEDGRFETHVAFGDGNTVTDADTWIITTSEADIVRIEEYWDDLTAFSTDRPESQLGGEVFDVMTFQTISPELAVCTWETMQAVSTEAALLAAGGPVIREAVVAASLDCGLDEEAISGLRLSLERSELISGQG